MRIAIIAALPGELKQIVNAGRWKKSRTSTVDSSVTKWTCEGYDHDEWIAVCAGMGAKAVRNAFAEAERDGKIDIIISAGWAGALDNSVLEGCTYIPSAVVDAQTGERFQLAGGSRKLILVTTARVADAAEKRRLAETYQAAIVDMEAAIVLRLAETRGIPVCCFKAVSDDLDAMLPDLNAFIDERDQLRVMGFVLHLISRPRYWKSILRLRRASANGSASLASAILTFLTGPKNVTETNMTGNVDW